ncbi:hypothetical protein cypCar_00009930 [Cyprinus carpio]|nr:hypothetical protein cypCar_00009930 [Cyprinus carpio]
MAAQKPVEWVQAVITRFDEQLPVKVGVQNTHTKISTEHNKECLINISRYKFSLVISGLTNILKNINNMQIFGDTAEKNLYLSQLIIMDTLEKCLAGAFWNWVENYADEFTKLYQRPQADMAVC